jgi:aconitate hydratase
MVAGRYLEASGCIPALEQLGFHITGYGCMACAGNSEPLPEPIAEAIDVVRAGAILFKGYLSNKKI